MSLELFLKNKMKQFETEERDGVDFYAGEFWSSQQRKAHSLHEISYRACFKPQLVEFLIDLFSKEGDVILDPFAGRGTVGLQATLMGRKFISNDVNQLSRCLLKPRIHPPFQRQVKDRLAYIPVYKHLKADIDLSMFFHENTLLEILSLREYIQRRINDNQIDEVDNWIEMCAASRLHGHSSGFLSTYTLPPNLCASQAGQKRINKGKEPEYKNLKSVVYRKSASLLKDVTIEDRIKFLHADNLYPSWDAREMPDSTPNCIDLTITSPPFLKQTDYEKDTWLKCWFYGLEFPRDQVIQTDKVGDWASEMWKVFCRLYPLTRNGKYVCFEVGEVKGVDLIGNVLVGAKKSRV